MKVRLYLLILFSLILMMSGCNPSADTSIENGCPFAPASSNFDTDGTYDRNCPGCFIEFTHRDEDYFFKLEELNWWNMGYAEAFTVEPLFAFYFSIPTANSQLFNSLDFRTELLQPHRLKEGSFDRIHAAFQIQNYCKDLFYPPQNAFFDSFNEISRIELIDYQDYEDFEIEEYAVSGRFETYIDVNGLKEPIKGRYKLLTKLRKEL